MTVITQLQLFTLFVQVISERMSEVEHDGDDQTEFILFTASLTTSRSIMYSKRNFTSLMLFYKSLPARIAVVLFLL